jgi:hypothetical protein
MAAGIAAPLLAAISFALVVLTLQLSSTQLRLANVALLLFVAAGLGFITAVQAGMWELRYRAGPGGSDRQKREHVRWAALTRNAYNVGILALLAGTGVLLVPPGPIPSVRLAAIALAGAGLVGELWWISLNWRRKRAAKKRLAEQAPRAGATAGQARRTSQPGKPGQAGSFQGPLW